MSSNDIEKGTRWRSGLANELEQASVSIICLTPENLEAPWINFKAGALSKQQEKGYVCTLLSKTEAAQILGISRKNLYERIARRPDIVEKVLAEEETSEEDKLKDNLTDENSNP